MDETQATRKTKIVCTMGPASWTPDMIRRLIQAGMNVARLNFSHGDHEGHLQTFNEIRAAAKEAGKEIGILQDLAGPKIRLGELSADERVIHQGEEVVLVSGEKAVGDELPVNYPYLYDDVHEGHRILLADGQMELLAVKKQDDRIFCEVTVGGLLTSHKGVNLPGSDLRISAFTDKDREDLAFGLEIGVDFVAMSFVRHEKDLHPLREMMKGIHRPPLLIAKIEKPQAVTRIRSILGVVEGIMVARGDLGVEMPVEVVPIVQKKLIEEARQAGRVVITATQMLRSMVDNPRPTRAEVTDVANAVLDGTDAVMLSEETAMGEYPEEAVHVLDNVCRYTEPEMDEMRFLKEELSDLLPPSEAAISRAATWLSRDLEPAAIMATTASGFTARLMARYRPPQPVVGITSEERTRRQLALSWGVHPILIPPCKSVDEMLILVKQKAADLGLAGPKDRLILTAGIPLSIAGTTNLIKVVAMDDPVEKGNY